jgi:hypothetical protein
MKPPNAHLKSFGLPQKLELVMVSEKEKIVVRALEVQMLEVNPSPKVPWCINMDCIEFPIGSAQRVVVEKAT